jgi:hypothetical protein
MDPAVAAVLGQGERRQRERRQTPAQRRQAARDAKRTRITLELDPRIVQLLREVAEVEGTSPAGAANLLLREGLRRYVEGGLEFHKHRRPSRSPRYEWVVELSLDGLTEWLAEKNENSPL